MQRWRSHIALTLLTLFVGGGWLAPALHPLTHALHDAARPEGSCHIAAAHTATSASFSSDANHVHDPDCDWCATRHAPATLVEQPAPLRTFVVRHVPVQRPWRPHVAPHTQPVIRGPPLA
ncbi:DUF2946 family protein [Salisaeta longa]|uniref:DUF2946 family protein n=1 Tax=Salisaeta longa TaxID=503170 RepID=UPI00041ABBFB|nr:DUF2946 family protein [Salisaeta longa]